MNSGNCSSITGAVSNHVLMPPMVSVPSHPASSLHGCWPDCLTRAQHAQSHCQMTKEMHGGQVVSAVAHGIRLGLAFAWGALDLRRSQGRRIANAARDRPFNRCLRLLDSTGIGTHMVRLLLLGSLWWWVVLVLTSKQGETLPLQNLR
jgi:hypothetical protein